MKTQIMLATFAMVMTAAAAAVAFQYPLNSEEARGARLEFDGRTRTGHNPFKGLCASCHGPMEGMAIAVSQATARKMIAKPPAHVAFRGHCAPCHSEFKQ